MMRIVGRIIPRIIPTVADCRLFGEPPPAAVCHASRELVWSEISSGIVLRGGSVGLGAFLSAQLGQLLPEFVRHAV
jgi:hypothetical protein